MMVLSEEA